MRFCRLRFFRLKLYIQYRLFCGENGLEYVVNTASKLCCPVVESLKNGWPGAYRWPNSPIIRQLDIPTLLHEIYKK